MAIVQRGTNTLVLELAGDPGIRNRGHIKRVDYEWSPTTLTSSVRSAALDRADNISSRDWFRGSRECLSFCHHRATAFTLACPFGTDKYNMYIT